MMPQTMHILALAGALCSAAATIFIRQGLRGGDPYTGFWINVVVGTASLLDAGGQMHSHPADVAPTMLDLAGVQSRTCGHAKRFREAR